MKPYKPRTIKFKELLKVNDWNLKVYTISENKNHEFSELYEAVKPKLTQWLSKENGFNAMHHHMGFLILHKGNEGHFIVLNWWVGENMLNTRIYFSSFNNYNTIKQISGAGLGPCIWELEVIHHEKITWTNDVLKRSHEPNFKSYLEATLNVEL